jgi:hypothetical protein
MISKAKQLMHDSYFRYKESWGNYKSDKHKSKRILKQEIISILVHGSFTRQELILIKNLAKDKAFKKLFNKRDWRIEKCR